MPKPHPIAQPSELIKKKDKDEKEKHGKEKDKIKGAKKLENIDITATGSITAGTWVAEMDSDKLRKNVLRK